MDEVTLLADSFNRMLDALEQNQQALRTASRYSRSLIEAHQGRLWVEPHAPGAIFHFDLPLA